jgi:hypothetical protein
MPSTEQSSGQTGTSTTPLGTVAGRIHRNYSPEVDKRLHVLRDAYDKAQARHTSLERSLREAEIQVAIIHGQITEREMDREDKEKEIRLPAYKTTRELDTAIEARGKAWNGLTEEETKEQRTEIYKGEAKSWIDAIAKEQPKETGTA